MRTVIVFVVAVAVVLVPTTKLVPAADAALLVSLKTSVTLPHQTKVQVFDFLATPSNWPKIVLSSWDVQESPPSAAAAADTTNGLQSSGVTNNVLRPKDRVVEVFGLPPLLPLKVCWDCRTSDEKEGILDVQSVSGVPGLAQNCRMYFNVQQQEEQPSSVRVHLSMEYEPVNLILGILAIPVLTVDNAVALKLLLPNALEAATKTIDSSPLAEFRRLMGVLYGISGVAHMIDCLLGPSLLLKSMNGSGFYDLDLPGQIYALLWCAMGPLAFATSRVGGKVADAGLIMYGIVEVLGAVAIAVGSPDAAAGGSTTSDVLLMNDNTSTAWISAVGVQAMVAASWFWTSRRKQ